MVQGDAYRQGLQAYKASSWETATHLFSAAIQENPEHAEAYHARSLVNRKLGRVKDGLADARIVVELKPDSHKGYLEAGRLCLMAGKLERAELMLVEAREKALPINKDGIVKMIEAELQEVRTLRAKAESRPISMLPTELFIYIIALAVENHESRLLPFASPQTLRINPLIAASHVSRAWRLSIHNAPRLWSSLHIDGERDRIRAVAKAKWWADLSLAGQHSLGSQVGTTSTQLGISRLTFTRTQTLGDHVLSEIIKELQAMGALLYLRHFAISWIEGVALQAVERHQFERAFRFLTSSCAPSLESLTVHTASHLRVGFSLPRFTNTFNAIRSLEMRSASFTAIAQGQLALAPTLLPPYGGEEDWPAATALQRLVIVNPIWRIEFPDGTLGAPILEPPDCPSLNELVVSLPTPHMIWGLFSSRGLRTLEVQNQIDVPRNPDPDLVGLGPELEKLKLVNSAAFTTRFLGLAATAGIRFPVLTVVDLRGALLTQEVLDVFGSATAPSLESLSVSTTSTASSTLALPLCSSLCVLNASATSWMSAAFIRSLSTSAPLLSRINLDNNNIPISALVEFVGAKQVGDVKELNMLNCTGVDEESLKWLKKQVRIGGLKYRAPVGDEMRPWKKTRGA